MAEFDNPRPSSQPVGSTELAVAKDNLIVYDNIVNSTELSITNRKGATKKTLTGLEALADERITTAIAAAGYQIVGDFADVIKVQITSANQVYTSQSVTNLEDAVWRYTGALPYTPTGSDPTQAPESGNWQAVAIGELKAIARSLNRPDSDVGHGDAGLVVKPILYARDQQVVYSVPALAVGKTIASVVGSTLNTTEPPSYQLLTIDNILTGDPASTAADIGDTIIESVPAMHSSFNYSILSAGAIGDGDIIVDRVDGLRAEKQIDGALDIKAFYRSGRTEQEILQAALNYASAKAGNWVVAMTPKSDGTPWEFTNLVVGSKTVFQHHGGRLRFADNVAINPSSAYYPILATGDDIWIDGLYVDGNGTNNSQFVVCDTITLGGGSGNKITSAWLLDAPDSGLMFSDNIGGIATGNHILGGRDVAIYANANSDGGSRGCVVSSNILRDFGNGGLAFKRYITDLTAGNNNIALCGNGVTFEDFGGGSYPKRITLSDTNLRDIGWTKRGAGVAERGISVGKTIDSTITGTTAINVSGDVFHVTDATDCHFSDARLRGYIADPEASGNNGLRVLKMTGGEILDFNVSGVANRAAYLSNVTNASLEGGRYVSPSESGIRVDATCAFDDFSPSYISGIGADLEWFAGATGRARNYTLANAIGAARNGFQTLSAGQGANPNGIITPKYVGEQCYTLADNAIWQSNGLTNADWVKLSN